ncbi:MAG: carbamoyltransferase HypF [Methylococcaceae bacterium]|nr:carbamoyltransferase HypF [Methylococcaceae bacterium]
MKHQHIQLNGFLQGVGFRPFVYRLAEQYQQKGWVANTSFGISLHIEGTPDLQQKFLAELNNNLPPFAQIKSLTSESLPLENFPQFTIKASQFDDQTSLFVLPDIATCPECVAELFNSASRYYQYPLISCCQCGPRYSIMRRQPYDRARTTMSYYPLCTACQQDFSHPENRRFHAQTIACSECGPVLQWMDAQGQELATKEQALAACIKQLHAGKIVAVKGIGGYQLLVNAQDEVAVARLRRKKMRPAKPFALLATDLVMVKSLCLVSEQEKQALQSAMAPIVLLKKHAFIKQYQAVAPSSHLLGVMLPSSGLQHLIMREFAQPLVATSANRAGAPICTDDQQALEALANIADYYLLHDRVILRALDDSIVRVIANKPRVLRRARGYAPLPIALTIESNTLALGGHLKSSWALSYQGYVLLSQYLGDMQSLANQEHFKQSLIDAQDFYAVSAKQLIHDQHPDYFTSHYAGQSALPSLAVQHHHAHALSCMAEHQLKPPVLAVTWDGTGLGEDYSSWGGEFFLIKAQSIEHFAHIKPLLLAGGDKANKEPRRVAIAILYELFGEQWQTEVKDLACLRAFTANELQVLAMVLKNKLNTPQSSSMGRLFDAVASLLNLCQINAYEGQAAACLEAIASLSRTDKIYTYSFISRQPIIIDWQEMFLQILTDLPVLSAALIAAKFHNTLADIILRIAQQVGEQQIVLSGGCFQNAILTEKVHQVLEDAGFQVYSHEQIPSNDAGLALGQLYYAHFYKNE